MIMIMMMIMKMMFSKEEMITMMKSCLVKQGTTEDDGDEGVKDLIEMTLRKMDHDKDGRVSYPDFQTTVTKAGILRGSPDRLHSKVYLVASPTVEKMSVLSLHVTSLLFFTDAGKIPRQVVSWSVIG